MSIEKHLAHRYYFKVSTPNSSQRIRVRTISKNKSSKNISNINNSLKNLHLNQNKTNHQSLETSFFAKQNIEGFKAINSSKQLPKYSVSNFHNPLNDKKPLRKNSSLRLMRNFDRGSQQLEQQIPKEIVSQQQLSKEKLSNNSNDSKTSIQKRKFSLKKRVDQIRKIHYGIPENRQKNVFKSSYSTQIQSQNLLGMKKKSTTKLKIMVRDPFGFLPAEKKRKQLFIESRIQPIVDQSLISQENKQQFQQFLSCLN